MIREASEVFEGWYGSKQPSSSFEKQSWDDCLEAWQAALASRKPLTLGQIAAAVKSLDDEGWLYNHLTALEIENFVRAIEAAHGITNG